MNSRERPITILVAALGGQGGGVLAEWLVEAATGAGFIAQSTSIPGVAQRTGATTYYIEIYPEPAAALRGRLPVLSLLPAPGCIDLFVASELLEAGRAAASGMVSPDRTAVVASTSRTLTTVEKMALGDGRYASDRLLDVLWDQARRLVTFDMDEAARQAGTAVSAVMFGAIAGSDVLPFGREACEAVIGEAGVGVEASLRGFALGMDLALLQATTDVSRTVDVSKRRAGPAASVAAAEAFPEGAREIVALGHARLIEFQDAAYADLYLDRLRQINAAEMTVDPRGGHDGALLRETARYLALWMAFDDVVRVADLKSRASRFARVRREVAAGERDVVKIVDYFKPGVPEIAGLLPAAIARRLLAWDRRRQQRGRPPFAIALHVRADTATGFLALRALATMKGLRRRGARYRDEQAAIVQWLDAILATVRADWSVAWEIARCGRLVKGYGATNERGKRNLAHILAHVAAGEAFAAAADRAQAIAAAREAALADEGGKALDSVLSALGVPPRPPVAQPVIWIRRPDERKRVA